MLLMANAGTNQAAAVKKIEQDGITVYSIHDAVCLSIQPGNLLVVGQSPEATQKAVAVLLGKSANLASSRTFTDFPDMRKAFFFLGMAEGFQFRHGPSSPGQGVANGRWRLPRAGGKGGPVVFEPCLEGETAEVVTQMQQVIQGLVALATLGQPDNKD